jgi:hypothetical protein
MPRRLEHPPTLQLSGIPASGYAAMMTRRHQAPYYADNGEDAVIMWRTPGTLRGTLDDVPGT